MALKHDLLQRVVMQNHSKNQWKWSNLWWLNMSNGEGSSRSYSFRNRNGSNFEVSKGIKTSSKKQPQKSWTTLFTTPFINHFREWAHFIYYPFINRYPSLNILLNRCRIHQLPCAKNFKYFLRLLGPEGTSKFGGWINPKWIGNP